MSGVPVLWQYNFSNFNEKARWALDHKRIPHRRVSLLPGSPRAMRFSLSGTVPVLEIEGRRIVDTTAIIAELERSFPQRSLYPEDPDELEAALELEEFFDEHAGHEMRRALFWELRDDPGYVARFISAGQPAPLRAWARVSMPIGWQYVKRRYSFEPDAAAAAWDALGAALDRIEAREGSFLVGDAFSVADLTAASLLWPLAWPDQLQYTVPEPRPIPRLTALREHPGVSWIRDTWSRHRPPPAGRL